MKAKIYSHEFLIGTTDLSVGDESMGGVFGDFLPTDFYFEKIAILTLNLPQHETLIPIICY